MTGFHFLREILPKKWVFQHSENHQEPENDFPRKKNNFGDAENHSGENLVPQAENYSPQAESLLPQNLSEFVDKPCVLSRFHSVTKKSKKHQKKGKTLRIHLDNNVAERDKQLNIVLAGVEKF